MPKLMDLSGKTFGKLTVVELDLNRSKESKWRYWLCQCACGNENLASVCTSELNNGKRKSCGCLRHKTSWRFIDLAGQVYGKITVVELDHVDKENGHYWKCLCDCGNPEYFLVSTRNIRGGKVLSCGCLRKVAQAKRKVDIIGEKFGQLTVFGFETDPNNGSTIWLSTCDCRNEKIIKSHGAELKNGDRHSCGCSKKSLLPFGESAFNRLFSTYKSRAISKGFGFEFTKDEFRNITKQDCFYCGREPFQKAPPNVDKKYHGYYIYNGVDRKDNSKGYTKENSVPCCGQCNVSKNGYTESDFIEWIKITYNNLQLKGIIGE